jgi:hypothetical protein
MVNKLEIDEDQETVPSDRKEYENHTDLEETMPSDRKEYENHMDLEPDHEAICLSGQEPESDMDLDPALLQACPTPPYSDFSDNGALGKFIGLAVKNLEVPAQFEGVKESDNLASETPNRTEFDESRFNDFKETNIAMAWLGVFLKRRKFHQRENLRHERRPQLRLHV